MTELSWLNIPNPEMSVPPCHPLLAFPMSAGFDDHVFAQIRPGATSKCKHCGRVEG